MKDTFLEKLKLRRKQTRDECYSLRRTLKNAPRGKLKAVPKKRKDGTRYYQYYVSYTRGTSGWKYIPVAKRSTAKALAQRDYESALLAEKEADIAFLNSTIKAWRPENGTAAYDALPEGRRQLVTPAIPTDEMLVAAWLRKKYPPNPWPEAASFQTDAGISVRSKSEVLIANHLWHAHIPFRYECPLKLRNGITVYPDFFILAPETRREYVWEHFGLMDDPSYIARNIVKINEYMKYLDMPSDSLIMTFEDKLNPLNKDVIDFQIRRLVSVTR